MVEEIREAFVELVDEASWVDSETKKLIEEKVSHRRSEKV